jgi:ectoine hydroxylase-related dioxygenase (phytanoyl-CoA dioxygenase family)
MIRTTLLGLFRRQVGRDEGTQFDMLGLDIDANAARQPQIIKPSVAAPELLRTEYFARLFAAARQVLGPDAQFSFDHSILKPAGSAAATPWHQDEAHHSHKYLRYRQVSFWMPLQDTPAEAGCMRYIPGSNRGALLAHDWLNHDPRIHAVECDAECVDESSAVTMPLGGGSSIAHDGRTLHAALPNASADDRLAYIVVFTAPPVLAANAREFTLTSTDTANAQRRARWLLRGGFLIYGTRRLRQGLRSGPRALWLKLCLLARVAAGARAGK